MTQPYIGQIMLFGFNFAPRNYALCNGQQMAISQNEALFSILGTTYGGNGIQTFALPDLRDRAAMHWGNGPGLTPRVIGEVDGVTTVTLTSAQLPQHTHVLNGATVNPANPAQGVGTPTNTSYFGASGPGMAYTDQITPAQFINMDPRTVSSVGGNQPHDNMQPYLGMNFCIALFGIFPSRN